VLKKKQKKQKEIFFSKKNIKNENRIFMLWKKVLSDQKTCQKGPFFKTCFDHFDVLESLPDTCLELKYQSQSNSHIKI